MKIWNLWNSVYIYWISNEIVIYINTILCLIKVNSKTIELTVHISCYCVLDLLWFNFLEKECKNSIKLREKLIWKIMDFFTLWQFNSIFKEVYFVQCQKLSRLNVTKSDKRRKSWVWEKNKIYTISKKCNKFWLKHMENVWDWKK